MHVVYGLQDPRDTSVFYVGLTNDLYTRFIQHIRCEGENSLKNARIGELKAVGLLPLPLTLETVNTLKHGQEREQYWIAHYVYLNAPLTNEVRPALLRRIKTELGEKATGAVFEEQPPASVVLAEKKTELARQVAALMASGLQKADIMRQIWRVNPGGSAGYQQAQIEYQQVMAFIASQIGA